MIKRLLSYILVMLISPIWALYLGFSSNTRRIKRWVLIIFITFFGSVLYLHPDASFDGTRHYQNLHDHYVGLSFSDFTDELVQILTLKDNSKIQEDPYIHVLSYFVTEVVYLPSLFFVIAAFVYGYFYAGSLFLLFHKFPTFKKSALFFYLASIFILWKSLEGIQYVRTFTGLWVLFYGILKYYTTKNRKYLLLIFSPPLIHIGYGMICIPAWIVVIFGTRKIIYTTIFILSFSVALINPDSTISQLERTEVGQSKVEGYYVDQEVLSEKSSQFFSGKTWYLGLKKAGLQNYAIAWIALSLIITGSYFKNLSKLEETLFSIGILTYAFANSTGFLYAVANRSYVMSGIFILSAVLLLWQRGYFYSKLKKIRYEKKFIFVACVMLTPFLVYQIANSLYWYSVFLFIAPFIPWIDHSLNMTLRQAIGDILSI